MQSAQFQLHAEIEQRHWWFTARRRIVRQLVERLTPPHTNATVVDVGCGTGANIAALADAYRCVGIDTSAEAIGLAQARFPQVAFRQGFAPADLGDEMARAQMITMMDVLEHVEDDAGLLAQLVAAAAPGTHFLLTVPADMSLWSQHDESFGHYRRYDAENFAKLWRTLPVEQRLLTYFNTRLYPAIKLVRTLSRLRGHSAGSSGTDFRVPAAWTNRVLERIFAGEAHALVQMLEQGRRPQTRGVSLLAVLTKAAS